MITTVAEDLGAVKELLLHDGWTQFALTNREGKHCLLGALVVVFAPQSHQTYDPKVHHYSRLLSYYAGEPDISWWNDRPNRTFEDVLELIDRAIAKEGHHTYNPLALKQFIEL